MAADNPIHVFVDANVFLSFYAYSDDDLEKLKRVKGLIEAGTLILYEPDQVIDEIQRNRETKIAEAIAEFAKERLSVKLPILMGDMAAANNFRKSCRIAEQLRNSLINEAKSKAASQSLPADAVIKEILDSAVQHKIDDKIYLRALRRNRSGNPPGKGARIGDELNWGALLALCPNDIDLHILSKDGDYRSALDKTKPHGFLVAQWKEKKNGQLYLHNEIGPFLSSIDKAIKLATDEKKNGLIAKFVASPSFAHTHSLISELKPYMPLFNTEDVEKVVRAGIDNEQINWIKEDSDVADFYQSLLKTHIASLNGDLKAEARKEFLDSPSASSDLDDEIPF